jgi:nitrogen regulatory protein P-II 2
VVILAEGTLERLLTADVQRLGAHGYNITDVRGAGSGGAREGAWDADRTIRMEVVCDAAVADAIAEHVLGTYAPHYGVTVYLADVAVFRPQKF